VLQDPLEDSSKDVLQDPLEDSSKDVTQDAEQGYRLEINLNINNKTKGTAGNKNLSCRFGNNK
jgi:hypothetical protein